MKEYVIIVAGGKGTRIQSAMPKQFLPLNGKPILLHTIEAFFSYSSDITVILVLPEDDFDTWFALAKAHSFNKPIILQIGGSTRFQSVKKGLEKIKGDGLVAIHDAVRPLIDIAIINASYRLATSKKTAVAAVSLKESIRVTEGSNTRAVDRSLYRIIQTPQTFDIGLIRKAYELKEESSLTDDASVAERAGYSISLFEGSYRNIKITTPEDLTVAEALLKEKE